MSSFMLGSPYAGPSSSRAQAHIEVLPGQYYSVKISGEDWPVVICDEETVQEYFRGSSRPTSARQADGTWKTDYKAEGRHVSKRSCPALIPGTLQFSWPVLEDLELLDPSMGEVIRKTTSNQRLAEAWNEAIRNAKADRNINYWKQRLASRQPGGIGAHALNGGNSAGNRKRKGTPNFKFPLGYAREEADDDEEAGTFLQSANNAKPMIKKESSDSISSSELDALYYEDATPHSPPAAPSSKRRRLDIARGCSTQPRTPVESETQAAFAIPSGSRACSISTESAIKTETIDQIKVTIYAGNPHTKFICKRSSLEASPYLSSLAVHHPDNGWYVMSPTLSNIPAESFKPIGEYLERGEYDPNLLEVDTDWVRLEQKQEMAERQRAKEVLRCGMIYVVARDLELPGLQDLAFRKLKALGKRKPHQAFAILCVVELVFSIGKEDIQGYLLNYLAVHYWAIVKTATNKAAEVMQNDDDLARRVFGLLSGLTRSDPIDQEGSRVKDEKEEEIPTTVDSSGLSCGTAQADDIGEKTSSRVISEAERDTVEMVKTAMRESDEQMTEEEITKTMLEQSRFFQS